MVEFRDARYGDDVTAPLIAEIQADQTHRYGGPDQTPVDPAEFTPPEGFFLVALVHGEVIGCGGVRRHDPVTAELKRMYVRPAHRRQGLASQILTELETRSRAAGYTRIVLETGEVQPEAVALYERHGYEPVDGFGHYRCSPLSRSYARALSPSTSRDTSASARATPER